MTNRYPSKKAFHLHTLVLQTEDVTMMTKHDKEVKHIYILRHSSVPKATMPCYEENDLKIKKERNPSQNTSSSLYYLHLVLFILNTRSSAGVLITIIITKS